MKYNKVSFSEFGALDLVLDVCMYKKVEGHNIVEKKNNVNFLEKLLIM